MLKNNSSGKGKDSTFGKGKDSTFVEQAFKINRVNKVTTGGKRLAFRAFVIVGDKNGRVGIGVGKSKEVPVAIKKGIDRAKKSLIKVNIVNGTLPHEVLAHFGAAKVLLKPAKPGTGVIAGGSVRILLESAGFKDVVAKCIGGSNTINNAKAAIEGLKTLRDYNEQVKLRGKKFSVTIKEEKKETTKNG
ncbi:30S ribosomal protein S5 [bacterium]|jgi:small subunit ribosomal protein S5|nr:30S ribosomal protein S5 [bacterium]